MELSNIVSEMMRIEEELRNLATELQKSRIERNEYVYDIQNVKKVLNNICEKLNKISEEPCADMISNILKNMVDLAYDYISTICNREDGYYKCSNISTREFRKFIEEFEKVTGRTCGNLLLYMDSVQLPAVIDGLANCIHVAAEELAKINKHGRRVGRCIIVGYADPRIIELCKKWTDLVEKYHNMGIYLEEDYNSLIGIGRGLSLDLRVGSSPGHAMKIDFKNGTLKYYDSDMNVIDTVRVFIEKHLDGSCMYDYANQELTCRFDPGADKVSDKLAWIAANVTSLDVYLDDEIPEYMKDRVSSAARSVQLNYEEASMSIREMMDKASRMVMLI
ncbi:MAG: hypothetical protein GXO26_08255 [Crenarchaeota archaeon]|nr:hypothetical protein [Thermoproteota archaeon]